MKNIIFLTTGFIIGIILTVIVVINMIPAKMMQVRESALGFNETVSAIDKNSRENGWALAKVWNFKKRINKAGFEELPRMKVLELCHAEHSYDILKNEDDRFISAIMPCRMAVWEKSDGSVFISRMNIGFMSRFFSDNIEKVMSEVAAEDEAILDGIVK